MSISFSIASSISFPIAMSISFSIASSISFPIAMSISRFDSITHGNHLSVTFFLEGNLNILGRGCLSLGLIGVGADFIVNILWGLSADSSGDIIALFLVNNALPYQVHLVTHSIQGGNTHLC